MKKLLTPEEVAKPILNISIPQLCRLTKAGKIPAKNLGAGKNACWRYDPDVLEQWMKEPDSKTSKPSPEAPVRRRKRLYTPVKRSIEPLHQVVEVANENARAHGTMSPASEL